MEVIKISKVDCIQLLRSMEANSLEQEVLSGKRVAEETAEQISLPAKKPRFAASVKMLPRRPSCKLLHREPHLQALSAALTKPLSHRAIDMAITGTAGVGKTELVLNFVAKHADQFQHILWINAETTETAESCVLEAAKMLEVEINKNQVHVPLLLNKIYNLCSETKCMVIFDNAANPEMLQKFLPPFHIDKSSMFTVVTSQFNEWDCETELKVECFTPKQSQQFLKQQLEKIEDTEAQTLSEMLGDLPLALQLAVSFINYKEKLYDYTWDEYSINCFIESLKDSPLDFLEHQLSTSESINYSKPLIKIFDTSIKNIRERKYGESVIRILSCMAYLTQNSFCSAMFNTSDDNESFFVLEKFSFFTTDTDDDFYSIIPQILPSIIRHKHTTLERKEYLDELLASSLRGIEFYPLLSAHCLECSFFKKHIEGLWDFAKEYPEFVKKYSLVPLALANDQALEGEFSDCVAFIERQIESYEKLLGRDHEHFLKIHMPYVNSLYKLKQYEKVLEICNKILQQVKNDKCTQLDLLHFKAKSLYKLNKLDEAFSLAKLVYKSQLHLSLKTKVSRNLDTLKLLCAIVSKKYMEDSSNALLPTYWMSLMTDQIQDTSCHDTAVYFLPTVEKYFKRIDQVDKMLLLYDKLQTNLELSQDKDNQENNLLNKAKFMCDLDRLQECLEICNKVYCSIDLKTPVLPNSLQKENMKNYLENLKTQCRDIQWDKKKQERLLPN